MIASFLDTDVYKFRMQAAVWRLYPKVQVAYEFINRNPAQRINRAAYFTICEQVRAMAGVLPTKEQVSYLQSVCPDMPKGYFDYLRTYRFQPSDVRMAYDDDAGFSARIEGKWLQTILWEVPLLAIIAEAYYGHVDTDWKYNGQWAHAQIKAERLASGACYFSEFGTRRRRSLMSQRIVNSELRDLRGGWYLGSSNPQMALEYDTLGNNSRHVPQGTIGHEWMMAHQVLASVKHSNCRALTAWQQVFPKHKVALTDTLSSDVFFRDVPLLLQKSFPVLRHDSGPWQAFVEKVLRNSPARRIMFSDKIDVDTALTIQRFCRGVGIHASFGIGSHFTNDFNGKPPLNMVVKLTRVSGRPVVKLSDVKGKETGDLDTVQQVRYEAVAWNAI